MNKFFLPQPVVMTGGISIYPTMIPTFVHNPVKGSDLHIIYEINRLIVSFMQRDMRLLYVVFSKWLNLVFYAA